MIRILIISLIFSMIHPSVEASSDSLAIVLSKIHRPMLSLRQQDSLLYWIHRGIDLAKEKKVDTTVVYLLSRLSGWHRMNGDISTAQQTLDEALVMLNSLQEVKWQIVLLLNQSNILFDQGNLPESISLKQQALDLALENEDSNHAYISAIQLAEVMMPLGDPADQINYYLNLAKNIGSPTPRWEARLNLAWGRYYRLIENYNLAVESLKQAISVAENHDDFKLSKDAYKFLSLTLEETGQYEEALAAHKLYMHFLQIEINTDNQVANLKMQNQIDAHQNESRLSLLKSQNEIKNIKNKRSRQILLIVLTLLSLITGLSLLILYINQKKIRSDQALLDYQSSMAEMRTRFYTNVSHEFRTPLTIIIGLCNQLESKGKLPSLIKRNADHLLQLVTQLLDLSKSEVGQLQPKYIHGNIVSFIRYLTESFIYLGENDGKNVTVYAEDSVINMDYDPGFIKHINYNLLSNSLKFTSRGDTITSHLKRENDFLVWKVVDTGHGIEQEMKDQIFERWERGKGSIKEGSGLGLAIVKEMVEILGGNIFLDSSIQDGTTVIIRLAIKNELRESRINELEETTSLITQQESDSNKANVKIALIAEDVPDVRYYIRSCLQDDFLILEAEDGESALSMALEYIPDIILTDVMMPKLDGLKLTEVIKKDIKTSHIPVIILSAMADQDYRIQGLSKGADAYLSKPFNEKELLVRINQLIQLREELAEKYKHQLIEEENIGKNENPFLQALEQSVSKSYHHHTFDVNQLANDLHLSRIQLYRKLKATADRTPAEFIRTYRLTKARQILSNGEYNVSEVAYMCGFSDPAHFSRLFSKTFGTSPSVHSKSTS